MRRLGLVMLVVPLVALGCGSNQNRSTTSSAPGDNTLHPVATLTTATPEVQTTPEARPTERQTTDRFRREGGFTGQDAKNYEHAKNTCRAISLRLSRARRQLKDAIAKDYAQGYRPAFRKAVEAGCRAGLR